MVVNETYKELVEILKKEVVPALGCSGPTAISYVVSVARAAVGGIPKSVKLKIDRGLCSKNDDVGIPGTDQLGVDMAAALGAICGDSTAGLNVLRNVTPADELKARSFAKTSVSIEPDWDFPAIRVYADATVETDKGVGRAVISRTHTNVILIEANGVTVFKAAVTGTEKAPDEGKDPIRKYSIKDFYDFASNIPLESIAFLQEAFDLNTKLAEYDLNDETSIGLGRFFKKISGNPAVIKAKTLTAAAATARMSGKELPAMSCATSGNVGITASLPLVAVAEVYKKDKEILLRSLALSYLLTIYIKSHIGRASAMCACVVGASSGIAAGTTFLLGGTLAQVEMAIQNTVPNFFGVLCDGARVACALKLSTAVGAAIECAYFALDNVVLPANQGVLGKTADESLAFLGRMGKEGMLETDKALCKSMYGKNHAL